MYSRARRTLPRHYTRLSRCISHTGIISGPHYIDAVYSCRVCKGSCTIRRVTNMRRFPFFLLVVVACFAQPVSASTVDDVVLLSKKGLSEQVLLAYVEKSASRQLTTAEIVRLKEAKVSENVIAAMIRRQPAAPPPAPTTTAPVTTAPVTTTAPVASATTTQPTKRTVYVYRTTSYPSTVYSTSSYPSSYYYPSYYSYYPRYSYPSVSLGFSWGTPYYRGWYHSGYRPYWSCGSRYYGHRSYHGHRGHRSYHSSHRSCRR